MLLFLFLLGLALGAASPSEDPQVKLERGSCPMFWYSFFNRCYKYVATRLTWADAELQCVSEGANLVSVHTQAEHEFVRSLIKNFDVAEGATWIGLSDLHKEGGWMWSDGCEAKFFFWNGGVPSDAESHCVYTNFNRKWHDMQCYQTFPSVCASRITCV